jgi:hypothetical protein
MALPAAPAPVPRDGRFWLTRLGVALAAVAAGLALQQVVAARLGAIQALAAEDVVAARRELAALLRVGGGALFGFLALVGLSIAHASRRALREARFPPRGLWGWGARRIVTGPPARTAGRVGVALGLAIAVLSALGGALVFELAARLLACRAT